MPTPGKTCFAPVIAADRKSTRLNSSHVRISYAVFCLKKKSLIDDLGINFNYNMMADSMKWSNINTNLRLKLTKSYTLSLNMVWDPYLYELDQNNRPTKVDKLRVFSGKWFFFF